MKKIWNQFRKLPWERRMIWSALLISLVPILAAALLKSPSETAEAKPSRPNPEIDTYIPKGFVLVPIEVQNYEALDSILGKFGVVDLFQRERMVARNVRMLRAPQNPSHFAILVQEMDAPGILKFGGSFSVIVRHPEQNGTEFVKDESKTHRSIVYERD